MPVRKVITLHAPMARSTTNEILKPVINLMETFGFRWWIGTEALPDLVLYIDAPQVWTERGPTQEELDHFFELHKTDRSAALAFVQEGWPPTER